MTVTVTEAVEMEYDQERDYEAFLAKLPGLLDEHHGEVVVIHDCEVIRFFSSMVAALYFGEAEYGAGMFIAQEIVDDSPDIVSYSLAV